MGDEILLEQAARLRTLVAIARANCNSRKRHQSIEPGATPAMQPDYPEPVPDDQARTIAAELLQRIALDASGAPFGDGDPETLQAAEEAEPEMTRLGPVRFRIINADAIDLAVAAGAIAPGETTLCMRVEFDSAEGAPEPAMGQYVVLPTEEPGVSLCFMVWLSRWDLDDPTAPDLDPGAVRNEAFDAIGPNEALLVQVLDDADSPQ